MTAPGVVAETLSPTPIPPPAMSLPVVFIWPGPLRWMITVSVGA
jgi:hypothetical protein